jgi:hypothetical protein
METYRRIEWTLCSVDDIRLGDGSLPCCAYPIPHNLVYLTRDNRTWCVDCANEGKADGEITDFFPHVSGEPCVCSSCGYKIESTYGEKV